jgi:hypothetical protein
VLGEVGKDGATLLATLKTVERMTGKRPDQLVQLLDNLPDFPDALGYLWEWFLLLSRTRQQGMGPSPITEHEINAFCRNRGLRMSLFELDAIRLLDSIAMSDLSKDEA